LIGYQLRDIKDGTVGKKKVSEEEFSIPPRQRRLTISEAAKRLGISR
jgi:hypothetical protein